MFPWKPCHKLIRKTIHLKFTFAIKIYYLLSENTHSKKNCIQNLLIFKCFSRLKSGVNSKNASNIKSTPALFTF